MVADNFQLRIEGDGVGHESVRQGDWADGDGGVLGGARHDAVRCSRGCPAYRLTKFQDCLPERFALEVIERYLLDVEGTVRWLSDNVA